MSSANNTRAATLAGMITSSSVEPTPFHLRQKAPLRLIVEERLEPLELGADVFRYLVPRRCHHRRP